MAPKGWANPAQQEFLEARMDTYRDAKAEGTVMRFHHKLYRDWFQAFPEQAALFPDAKGELTAEQTIALGEAIRLRKNVSNIQFGRRQGTAY